MKDILIIGGFNWLGFELTKFVINNNMFSNIIIVDVLKDFLLKDNKTKNQFDEYAHLDYGINDHFDLTFFLSICSHVF